MFSSMIVKKLLFVRSRGITIVMNEDMNPNDLNKVHSEESSKDFSEVKESINETLLKKEAVSSEPKASDQVYNSVMEEEDMVRLSRIKDILDIPESSYPEFVLAKNKARFRKKLIWYKAKKDWLDIAPYHKINKLFKQQSKELAGIRSSKLDYEMELEMGSLTPSQKAYRKDELKMCRVHEKMAVQLLSKIQLKFRLQSR